MSTINASTTPQNLLLSWVMVIISSLFFAYIFIQMNMLNAIGDELVREFNLSAQHISQVFASFTYGNLLFLFPAGLLLDKFSTRNIIVTVFSIAVIASYLFSISTSYAMMNVYRFIIGVMAAFSFLSALKMASQWFTPKQMALASGMIATIGMIGGLIAQTPLAMLTARFGWRHAVQLVSALGLAIVLLQIAVLRDVSGRSKNDLKTSPKNDRNFFGSLGLVLANRQNWLAGLYTCLTNIPVLILGGAWGTQYLMQVHRFDKIDATNIISMIFVGMIIGSPTAGWISDRLKLRKLPMIMGAILCIIVIAISVFAPILPRAVEMILYLLMGFCCSAQVIGYPVISENNPKAVSATATSIASTLIVAAGALVPVYGWLLDRIDASVDITTHIHSASAFLSANCIILIGDRKSVV